MLRSQLTPSLKPLDYKRSPPRSASSSIPSACDPLLSAGRIPCWHDMAVSSRKGVAAATLDRLVHLLFFQSSTESESCFKRDVTFWTPARSPCDGVIITFVYASHRCADGKTIAANQVDPKLEAAGFGCCWREISDSDSIRRRRDDHAGCERMVPVFDDRLV